MGAIRGVSTRWTTGAANLNRDHQELAVKAGIAAVTQITGRSRSRPGWGWSSTWPASSRKEATRKLARLAVFALEKKVRDAAIEVLSVRRESDYTEVLVKGLATPGRPSRRTPPTPS